MEQVSEVDKPPESANPTPFFHEASLPFTLSTPEFNENLFAALKHYGFEVLKGHPDASFKEKWEQCNNFESIRNFINVHQGVVPLRDEVLDAHAHLEALRSAIKSTETPQALQEALTKYARQSRHFVDVLHQIHPSLQEFLSSNFPFENELIRGLEIRSLEKSWLYIITTQEFNAEIFLKAKNYLREKHKGKSNLSSLVKELNKCSNFETLIQFITTNKLEESQLLSQLRGLDAFLKYLTDFKKQLSTLPNKKLAFNGYQQNVERLMAVLLDEKEYSPITQCLGPGSPYFLTPKIYHCPGFEFEKGLIDHLKVNPNAVENSWLYIISTQEFYSALFLKIKQDFTQSLQIALPNDCTKFSALIEHLNKGTREHILIYGLIEFFEYLTSFKKRLKEVSLKDFLTYQEKARHIVNVLRGSNHPFIMKFIGPNSPFFLLVPQEPPKKEISKPKKSFWKNPLSGMSWGIAIGLLAISVFMTFFPYLLPFWILGTIVAGCAFFGFIGGACLNSRNKNKKEVKPIESKPTDPRPLVVPKTPVIGRRSSEEVIPRPMNSINTRETDVSVQEPKEALNDEEEVLKNKAKEEAIATAERHANLVYLSNLLSFPIIEESISYIRLHSLLSNRIKGFKLSGEWVQGYLMNQERFKHINEGLEKLSIISSYFQEDVSKTIIKLKTQIQWIKESADLEASDSIKPMVKRRSARFSSNPLLTPQNVAYQYFNLLLDSQQSALLLERLYNSDFLGSLVSNGPKKQLKEASGDFYKICDHLSSKLKKQIFEFSGDQAHREHMPWLFEIFEIVFKLRGRITGPDSEDKKNYTVAMDKIRKTLEFILAERGSKLEKGEKTAFEWDAELMKAFIQDIAFIQNIQRSKEQDIKQSKKDDEIKFSQLCKKLTLLPSEYNTNFVFDYLKRYQKIDTERLSSIRKRSIECINIFLIACNEDVYMKSIPARIELFYKQLEALTIKQIAVIYWELILNIIINHKLNTYLPIFHEIILKYFNDREQKEKASFFNEEINTKQCFVPLRDQIKDFLIFLKPLVNLGDITNSEEFKSISIKILKENSIERIAAFFKQSPVTQERQEERAALLRLITNFFRDQRKNEFNNWLEAMDKLDQSKVSVVAPH